MTLSRSATAFTAGPTAAGDTLSGSVGCSARGWTFGFAGEGGDSSGGAGAGGTLGGVSGAVISPQMLPVAPPGPTRGFRWRPPVEGLIVPDTPPPPKNTLDVTEMLRVIRAQCSPRAAAVNLRSTPFSQMLCNTK